MQQVQARTSLDSTRRTPTQNPPAAFDELAARGRARRVPVVGGSGVRSGASLRWFASSTRRRACDSAVFGVTGREDAGEIDCDRGAESKRELEPLADALGCVQAADAAAICASDARCCADSLAAWDRGS